MAKKKPAPGVPLTDAEIDQLAGAIHGTCLNVYHKAAQMFPGKEVTDADWERLRKIGNVFKCDECNEWKTLSCESGIIDRCESCNDDIENPD